MSHSTIVRIGAVLLVLFRPGLAHAQSSTGLAGLLPDLLLREIMLPAPSTPGVFTHSAHFSPLLSNDPENPAVGIVKSLNTQLAVQVATSPLASSAGGFTYSFDSSLGTFRRSSPSFGPTYAERASTNGRHRLSAGFNYQHLSYSTLEGQDLQNGSIKIYLRHEDCCSTGGPAGPPFFGVNPVPDGSRLTPFFEGDLIQAALSLTATTDRFTSYSTYGVTNRWDIGLAVPVVRVALDATVHATILRLATGSNAAIHTFVAGDPNATTSTFVSAGSATGLGDVVLRTKYRLAQGIAVAVDWRLPTGNRDDLLGAGNQVKAFFIGSNEHGRLGEHVNVGYTWSSGELTGLGEFAALAGTSQVPNEFNYTGGVEFVPESRLTIIGDMIGRTLINMGRLTPELKTFDYQTATAAPGAISTAQFEEFAVHDGNLNVLLGTAGVKYNPVGNLLISAHVLFPLTTGGLKSRVSPTVGVDYTF